jgi:hypothetical protein
MAMRLRYNPMSIVSEVRLATQARIALAISSPV